MSRSAIYAALFGLEPRDFWRTPPEVIAAIEQEFGPIGLDACAMPDDAVCSGHIGPADDCRKVEWGPICRTKLVFVNPPYSRRAGGLLSFMDCAADQSGRWDLTVIVLAPPGVGSAYRRLAVAEGAEIRDLPKRLSFLHPDTGLLVQGNREGSSLFIFRGSAHV